MFSTLLDGPQMSSRFLVVVKHVIKGFDELIGYFLDLQLLTVDFILNVINPVVQLGDVHLSVFIASFSMLESLHKLVNFVLQFLLTLLCFLSRDLKLLHVLTNSLKLLLNIPQFTFSQLGTFIGPLQLLLLYSTFPRQLIEFLFIVTGHLGSLPQVLVCFLNLNFVPHGLVLKVLDLLQDSISLLRSHGQFSDSFSQIGVSLLGLFLHQHDTSGQSRDFFLSILKALLPFLISGRDLGQLVIGLIKVTFVALDLLANITDVTLKLIVSGIGLLGLLFILGNGGMELVRLIFEGLHLLSDGIHVCGGLSCIGEQLQRKERRWS